MTDNNADVTGAAESTARSVADVIATAVAATGATLVFGHPGGEVVRLIDAFEAQGVRFILTHHETFAGFMACGYGEITGRPGVCLATLGPGATNMVTAMAGALLERAPVLAITGSLATSAAPGATHQELDLNALYTPISKQSLSVTADNAAEAATHALALAVDGRRGPVHLSVPSDVATAPAGLTTASQTPAGSAAEPAIADLGRARHLIAAARRPAIIAGLRADRDAIADALTELSHQVGAPVAVLPKAKGAIAEDDALFAGVIEMAGNDLVVDLLRTADLILAVGLDVVEMDKPWLFEAPVVMVDTLANLDGYFHATVELVGDIASTLRALIPAKPSAGRWAPDDLVRHRQAVRSHVCARSGALAAWEAVDAVRAAMPRSTVATTDVGIHKFLVGQIWTTYEPRTFFMSNGLSSMGYGLPVAAASWLVNPACPVVAFIGDGGLAMYLGELETLTRMGADLLIVVFADNSLELIRRAQMRHAVSTVGTHFSNPRFEAVGSAFGIATREARTREELDEAVADLANRPGVRLLAVHIDGDDYRL